MGLLWLRIPISDAKETKSCDHSPTGKAEEVGTKAQTGDPDCLCWKDVQVGR